MFGMKQKAQKFMNSMTLDRMFSTYLKGIRKAEKEMTTSMSLHGKVKVNLITKTVLDSMVVGFQEHIGVLRDGADDEDLRAIEMFEEGIYWLNIVLKSIGDGIYSKSTDSAFGELKHLCKERWKEFA